MSTNAIRISKETSTASFPAIEVANPLVADFFGSLPDRTRMAAFEQAIVVGVMALRDERIAAFLAKTESELGANLEFLKHLFDRDRLRLKAPVEKGDAGEAAVANALADIVEARRFPDSVQMVGRTTGALPRNKSGDIVISVGEGQDAPTITIEVKLDKSIRLGDPAQDGMTSGKSDTAWSQLVESRANRDSELAIMVFSAESVDRTVSQFTDSVRYIPGIGFIAIVDLARSDFRSLAIAYELARQRLLARDRSQPDPGTMDVLVRRLCADLSEAMEVRALIQSAVDSCKAAMTQIEKSLFAASATQKALQTYVETGQLTNQQLLALLVPHKAPAIAMD